MSVTGTLNGRAVELRTAGFGAMLDAQAVLAATNDRFRMALVIMAASAHWADTGEKIFADLAAVEAWPMVDSRDLTALATLANEVNAPRETPAPNGAMTNGTGDTAHPI